MSLPKLSNPGAVIGPIGVIKFGQSTGFSSLAEFANDQLKKIRDKRTDAEDKAIRIQEAETRRLRLKAEREQEAKLQNLAILKADQLGTLAGIARDSEGNLQPYSVVPDGSPESIRRRASALAAYRLSISRDIDERLAAFQRDYPNDPVSFANVVESFSEEMLDGLDPVFQQVAAEELANRIVVAQNDIDNNANNLQKLGNAEETFVQLESTTQTAIRSIATLGFDEAAPTIVAERENLIQLIELGEEGGYLHPEVGARALRLFDAQVRLATQRYIGQSILEEDGVEALKKYALSFKLNPPKDWTQAQVTTATTEMLFLANLHNSANAAEAARAKIEAEIAREVRVTKLRVDYRLDTDDGGNRVTPQMIDAAVLRRDITGTDAANMIIGRINTQRDRVAKFEGMQIKMDLFQAHAESNLPLTSEVTSALDLQWNLQTDFGRANENDPDLASIGVRDARIAASQSFGPKADVFRSDYNQTVTRGFIQLGNEDTLPALREYIGSTNYLPPELLGYLKKIRTAKEPGDIIYQLEVYKMFRDNLLVVGQLDEETSAIFESVMDSTSDNSGISYVVARDQALAIMNGNKNTKAARAVLSDFDINLAQANELLRTSEQAYVSAKRSAFENVIELAIGSDPVRVPAMMEDAFARNYAGRLQKAKELNLVIDDERKVRIAKQSFGDLARVWAPTDFSIGSRTYSQRPIEQSAHDFPNGESIAMEVIRDMKELFKDQPPDVLEAYDLDNAFADGRLSLVAINTKLNIQNIPRALSALLPGTRMGTNAEGRGIFVNHGNGLSTQQMATVKMAGKYYNIPTMFGGQKFTVGDSIKEIKRTNFVDAETKLPIEAFKSEAAAVANAKARSDAMNKDPAVRLAFEKYRAHEAGIRTEVPVMYRVIIEDEFGDIHEISMDYFPRKYQASLHAERERKIGRLKEILPFPYNTEIGVRAGVYVDQVVDETIGEAYRAVMERFALLRAAEPGLNVYYSKSAKRSWQTQSREGDNGTATMAEQPDYDPDYRPK